MSCSGLKVGQQSFGSLPEEQLLAKIKRRQDLVSSCSVDPVTRFKEFMYLVKERVYATVWGIKGGGRKEMRYGSFHCIRSPFLPPTQSIEVQWTNKSVVNLWHSSDKGTNKKLLFAAKCLF